MILPGAFGLLKPSSAAGFTTSAKSFDGSTSFAARGADLTGAADGQHLTISWWFNPTVAVPANNAYLLDTSGGTEIYLRLTRQTATTYKVAVATGSGAAFNPTSSSTYTVDTGWHHALLSFNRATGAGHLYVDDVLEATSAATPSGSNLDLTHVDWFIGKHASLAASFLRGCESEGFVHFGSLDLTTTANRRLFISAGLDPVDLGADGSTPFGAQPIIYIRADPSNNLGTGGNFTNTAITDCGTAP